MDAITTTTYTPDEIRAAGPAEQFLRIPVTLKSGTNFAAGTVLGKITASGKYDAYADGNADGTETAVGILADDTDATSADKFAEMYIRGNFVVSKLTGLDANGIADIPGARSIEGVLYL